VRRAPAILADVVAAVALAAAGCSAATPETSGCHAVCGPELVCVGGSCLPHAMPPAGWALELEPASDDLDAAFTESTHLPAPDRDGNLVLRAWSRVAVNSGFVSAGSNPAPMAGHVVLTIPAAIPGRPDQQLETDVMVASVDSPVPYFTVPVPDGALGRTARIVVSPNPPDDHVRPPLTFAATLAARLDLTVPAQLFQVTGNLYAAEGTARSSYVARAFLDGSGQLVSNVAGTDMGGGFSLVVPATADVTNPGQQLTVELRPPDSSASAPRFVSKQFSLSSDFTLGNLYEPAFALPNVYRFSLHGEEAGGPPVANAVVRVRTVLESDANGSSDYQRDGRSDTSGNADLSLLPGTLNASRHYTVAVTPPASSPYGVSCLPDFPLTTGGTASAPALLQVITLPRRPTFSGTLVSADGAPVERASITATPLALDPSTGCTDTTGLPATATTGADGSFSLVLDPGQYRFDYDPPSGAPVPRLTEPAVAIPGDSGRTIKLARGGVVDGKALRADGSKLSSANVRLYEVPTCPSAAGPSCGSVSPPVPLLRAQTRTDASGAFRAVVPLP
jgi:hypothetical protein